MARGKFFGFLPAPLCVGLIGAILGALGVLAFSPFDQWWLMFISVIGLLWIARQPERKTALWGTFAWAMGYFGVGVSWVQVSMIQFGGVPEIVSYGAVALLAAYLSLYFLLFTYLAHRLKLHAAPFLLAALFTATEYLRSVVFTGFPWLQLGYSQIDSPFFGIAPFFGVEGLSFFVMLISAMLLNLLTALGRGKFSRFLPDLEPHRFFPLLPDLRVGLTTANLVFWLALGVASQCQSFVQPTGETASIALVQGNIEQKMKWDTAYFSQTVQTYADLIRPQLGKADVIILPESAIPAEETQIAPLLLDLQQMAQEKGSEILLGTLYQNPAGQLFNSAVVLGNTTPYAPHTPNRYTKHHLVPFGEYVPFGGLLDALREVFILPINLSQGEFVQPALTAKNHRFNLAICYEIIFGDQVQQNQKAQKADYLLTISNDAWFGASIGPWQHFQMARMRALENGKPLIRATNTGITAVVGAHGEVWSQLPQFQTESEQVDVPKMAGETFFTRFGNVPIYGLSATLFALFFLFWGIEKCLRGKNGVN